MRCPSRCFATLGLTFARGDARRWEDEIVYGVIIEKFFDGNLANDIMSDRFSRNASATKVVSGEATSRA